MLATSSSEDGLTALFIQGTDAASYPPLINVSLIMAERGWEVHFLSAPIANHALALTAHPRIFVHAMRTRPSHVMSKADYALYWARTAKLAVRLRPDVVYASDPLGAGPGLLAARLARAMLVYHEHDSPDTDTLNRAVVSFRKRAAHTARILIIPNDARAKIVQRDLGVHAGRVRVVWNLPRRAEVVPGRTSAQGPLILYYHGSITPDRIPGTVIDALLRFNGQIRLRITGYEAPGAEGYVEQLIERSQISCGRRLAECCGPLSRADLLTHAAQADVGLSLMPKSSSDINMRHMVGASNKPFDYMAAGLPLIVSDLPDWKNTYVRAGFGKACDPSDAESIATTLRWFLDHPLERRQMAENCRRQIASDWNYDAAFAPVLAEIGALRRAGRTQ
jgi:glycosyltransferase involved in cell wall biosynthesis